MANVLIRNELVDGANPKLEVFFKDRSAGGALIDVDSLEFAIFERVTTPPTLVQTFPPSGRSTVDVTALFPTGDKLATGHYAARYTVPDAEVLGEHVIKWHYKVTPTSVEQCFAEEFQVAAAAGAPLGGSYCTVQDLRDAGVPSTGIGGKTDAELQALIAKASRLVEKFTGRFFEPRSLVVRLDGTGRHGLLVGDPIVSITSITLISDDFVSNQTIDLSDVRIYNRHLTQNLLNPDDRENPRIEFLEFDRRHERIGGVGQDSAHHLFHPHRWPEGTQNVELDGVFGYTDFDGTSTGKVPDLIGDVTCLIALRMLPAAFSDPDKRADVLDAWKVTEYKTRDQTIKYASPDKLGGRGVGAFTGDPQIDTILALYTRPPMFGAV